MCRFDGVGSHFGRTESEYLRNGVHVIEAVERSLCDRTHCVRERLRRRCPVHAGISMCSSERGKEDPYSIHQQTQESQSHACFD
jgi:hypothetical protein